MLFWVLLAIELVFAVGMFMLGVSAVIGFVMAIKDTVKKAFKKRR